MKLRLGDKIFLGWLVFTILSVLVYPIAPWEIFLGMVMFVGLPWIVYNYISNKKLKQRNALQHY